MILYALGDLVFEPDNRISMATISLASPQICNTEEGSSLRQQPPFGQGYHEEEIYAPKTAFFLSVSWLNLFSWGDLVILSNIHIPHIPLYFLRRAKKGIPKWKKVHKQWAKSNGIKAIQNILRKLSNNTRNT